MNTYYGKVGYKWNVTVNQMPSVNVEVSDFKKAVQTCVNKMELNKTQRSDETPNDNEFRQCISDKTGISK